MTPERINALIAERIARRRLPSRRVMIGALVAVVVFAAGFVIASTAGTPKVRVHKPVQSLGSQISQAVANGIRQGLGETTTTTAVGPPPKVKDPRPASEKCSHLAASPVWDSSDMAQGLPSARELDELQHAASLDPTSAVAPFERDLRAVRSDTGYAQLNDVSSLKGDVATCEPF